MYNGRWGLKHAESIPIGVCRLCHERGWLCIMSRHTIYATPMITCGYKLVPRSGNKIVFMVHCPVRLALCISALFWSIASIPFATTDTSDGFRTGGGKGLARNHAARAIYFYSATLLCNILKVVSKSWTGLLDWPLYLYHKTSTQSDVLNWVTFDRSMLSG